MRLVCAVVVLASTAVGVFVFGRAVATIVNRMRVGRPVPRGRLRPVGRRLVRMLAEVVGHTAFKGRPWIRATQDLECLVFLWDFRKKNSGRNCVHRRRVRGQDAGA